MAVPGWLKVALRDLLHIDYKKYENSPTYNIEKVIIVTNSNDKKYQFINKKL